MPYKFKQKIDGIGKLDKALRNRVSDEAFSSLSEKEVDVLVKNFLIGSKATTELTLGIGQPINSHSFANFIRDTKFYIGAVNSQAGVLEENIRTTTKDNFSILNDIQHEALVMDAVTTEEEIKIAKSFTSVHFNSFVRAIDFDLGKGNKQWFVDYKTQLPFLDANISKIVPGSGLMLPVKGHVNVSIVDVELVGEETDVGDTRKLVKGSSPRNLLLKNRIFRHVIARREFDNTSRKYEKTYADCSLLLTFGSVQLLNHLKINPVGHSTLDIIELSFINESGEEVSLLQTTVAAETYLLVMFEPVRTKYMKIKFRQYAPVTKTSYKIQDSRVQEINRVLRGVGFSQTLQSNPEDVSGRIFDFSIESISAGLYMFESLGVFRSQPINVVSPLGLTISDRVQTIDVVSAQHDYGNLFSLPQGTVLHEFYVGCDLRDKSDNIVLRDILPVPDSYPIQTEFLPIIGGESKVKLFPDFTWNLDKYLVDSVSVFGTSIRVTTSVPHGLEVDDLVAVVGPINHLFNGEFTVESIIDQYSFTINVSVPADYVIGSSTLPYSYIYKANTGYVDNQESPFTVYSNGDLLTLGTDYKYSLNFGKDWYSTINLDTYIDALRHAASGRFFIKILNPDYENVYWTEYRPLTNQFLGRTKLAMLKNGRVVFGSRLAEPDISGTLNTIVVSRANSSSLYISSIISYYALKVRENVS